MVEQRLPIIDGDDGQWGEILNQFLQKEHYDTGSDDVSNGGHQTITIRPGTASAGTAPITFTSGTLLTTPETGAMEFAGDNYYLTDTSGPTRRKIAAYDDTSGATGDIYYRTSGGYFARLGIGSTDDVLTVSGGLPSWQPAQGSTTMSDADFTLQNDSDATKQLQLDLSGITTGTTRTLTVPDADTTLVGTDTSQTLTNKTLTNPKIDYVYDINGNVIWVFAGAEGTIVNTVGTSNATSGYGPAIWAGGTDTDIDLNLFSKGAGKVKVNAIEVATVSDSQTLTDKTISGTDNTLTNIPQEQLATTNLLTANPSFDTDISSWGQDGSNSYSWDGSIGRIANGSATITVTNTNRYFSSDIISVTPGVTYIVGGWVKTSSFVAGGGSVNLGLNEFDSYSYVDFVTPKGETVATPFGIGTWNTISADGSFDWKWIGGQYTVPSSGVNQIALSFNVQGTSGTVWIDDTVIARATIDQTWIGGLGYALDSIIYNAQHSSQTLQNKTLDNTNTATLKDTSFILQDDGDSTKKLQLQLGNITTGTTRTLAVPDANATIVGTDTTQTLTNKTISGSSNTLSNIGISSLSTTGTASSSTYLRGDGAWAAVGTVYTANVGDGSTTSYVITHNLGTRSVAISVYDASTYEEVYCDKFRTTTNTVTLVFGTAPASNAYVCVITNGSVSTTINSTDVGDSTATGRSLLTASSASAARTAISAISASSTDTLQNKTIDNSNSVTIKDANWTMQDDGDTTKQLKFQLSGITTSTTRTLTVPDASTTLVGTDATQTLTNKTISGSSNTISNIPTSALPYSGATAAFVATQETTTSTTYADLTTTTDTVTVTIGASGMALVTLSAGLFVTGDNWAYMSFVASGANTIAASDTRALGFHDSSSYYHMGQMSFVYLATGLSAGSTTFKAKYRVSAGTGTYSNRYITVIPL